MKKQYILTEEEYQSLVNEKEIQRSKFNYVLKEQLAEIKKYRKELGLIIEMIDGTYLNILSAKQKLIEIKARIQWILHIDPSKHEGFGKIMQEIKDNDNKIMLRTFLKLDEGELSQEEIDKIVQDIVDSYKNL